MIMSFISERVKSLREKNFVYTNFFLKVMLFMRLNVKKYDRARQATDDNTVHVLQTRSECVVLLAFPWQQ
jgi:hypothetical protein